MKIRMIQNYRANPLQLIRKDEVLEVRPTINNFFNIMFPYQVISGEFSGIKIPLEFSVEVPEEPTYSLAEYTEVHQELIRKREEVKDLKYKLDAANGGRNRAESAADCLEKELQEAREWKKVSLPRDVAEAIEWFRKQTMDNEGIYELASKEDDGLFANILFRWVEGNGSRDELMEALVNGYTIEEPEETPKQKAIQHLIKQRMVARGHSEHDVVTSIMSILGTEQSG